MKLPSIDELEVSGKRILVRGDLDVDVDGIPVDDNRLDKLLLTINKLIKEGASKIIILGHRGRPTEREDNLSTKYLCRWFEEKLGEPVHFMSDFGDEQAARIVVFENLRFWEGEESNSLEFAQNLAKLGEVFVNDAFATSHRAHASLVGVAKLLPHAAGQQLLQEIKYLSMVLNNPTRPVVFVISGIKEDKLSYVDAFEKIADKILIAGRLPEYLGDTQPGGAKLVARLLPDKEDITIHSIESFEEVIKEAGTVVVSGPIGKFEEEGHRMGTKRVFKAITESHAFKLAGGGDTEEAIKLLNLEDKFDWISTGGGAMLDFLANGSLPGIDALLH
ncbi:phosphoglycerate kinase [Candidatus Microgenomates bacterium]|nr:MAG: phosphoglycerate kinase [Candidatus Microgenomates bacterium]